MIHSLTGRFEASEYNVYTTMPCRCVLIRVRNESLRAPDRHASVQRHRSDRTRGHCVAISGPQAVDLPSHDQSHHGNRFGGGSPLSEVSLVLRSSSVVRVGSSPASPSAQGSLPYASWPCNHLFGYCIVVQAKTPPPVTMSESDRFVELVW